MGILNKLTKQKQEEATDKKTSDVVRVKKNDSTEASVRASTGSKSDFASRILLRTIVSEKSTDQEANKKYTFLVSPRATKVDVKRAVKQVYGILPLKVNMIVGEGKAQRFGRMEGKRNNSKKAIVTVAKDKVLAIHEGV